MTHPATQPVAKSTTPQHSRRWANRMYCFRPKWDHHPHKPLPNATYCRGPVYRHGVYCCFYLIIFYLVSSIFRPWKKVLNVLRLRQVKIFSNYWYRDGAPKLVGSIGTTEPAQFVSEMGSTIWAPRACHNTGTKCAWRAHSLFRTWARLNPMDTSLYLEL